MFNYQKMKIISASQYANQTGDVFLPAGLRRNNVPHVQVLNMQRQTDNSYQATCFDFDQCRVRTLVMLPTQPLIVEV